MKKMMAVILVCLAFSTFGAEVETKYYHTLYEVRSSCLACVKDDSDTPIYKKLKKLGVLGLENETMKAQMVAMDQLFNIFGEIKLCESVGKLSLGSSVLKLGYFTKREKGYAFFDFTIIKDASGYSIDNCQILAYENPAEIFKRVDRGYILYSSR